MDARAQEVAPPTSGSGKFYYANGATYEGEWALPEPPQPEDGEEAAPAEGEEATDEVPKIPPVRQGQGKYTHGEYVYEGEWSNDKMHGVGKFLYASGASYEGDWVDNVYSGKGKYTFPDGTVYEGDFADNTMHGEGVYTDAAGHRWAGTFYNGSGPGLTNQL